VLVDGAKPTLPSGLPEGPGLVAGNEAGGGEARGGRDDEMAGWRAEKGRQVGGKR